MAHQVFFDVENRGAEIDQVVCHKKAPAFAQGYGPASKNAQKKHAFTFSWLFVPLRGQPASAFVAAREDFDLLQQKDARISKTDLCVLWWQ